MAVDDRTRLNLLRRLEAVLGQEEAETLMAHLPPVTWQEVVTKTDLRVELDVVISVLRGEMAELRTEMADLRTELRTEMADLRTELRTEMADLRTELRTEMADLRTEVRTGAASLRIEMADLRTELRTEIADAITSQTWRLATFIGTWSVLLVTVTALLR